MHGALAIGNVSHTSSGIHIEAIRAGQPHSLWNSDEALFGASGGVHIYVLVPIGLRSTQNVQKILVFRIEHSGGALGDFERVHLRDCAFLGAVLLWVNRELVDEGSFLDPSKNESLAEE